MQTNKTKNILLMRLDRLGDIILTIPAIRALRGKFSNSRICLLVNENVSFFYELKKYADDIIRFRRDKLFDIILKLRKTKFDLAVDLLTRADNLSAFVLGAARAKEKYGFNAGLRRLVLNKRFNFKQEELYEVDILFKFLEDLDIKSADKALEVSYEKEDGDKVSAFLGENNIKPEDVLIGIQCFAGDAVKMWQKEKFTALIKKILGDYNVKIILTGSVEEKDKIKAAFKDVLSSNVINSAGELNLTQLIALINRFKMFITNNTGPMHIARAAGVPLLLINGYSSLKRWGVKDGENFIVKKDYDCAPCEFSHGGNCVHKDYRCIKDITVDEVFDGFEKLWRRLGQKS